MMRLGIAHRTWIGLGITLSVLVSGCAPATNQGSTTGLAVAASTKMLPDKVQSSLSSYKVRVHEVKQISHENPATNVQNVLYISPTTGYAITQLISIWPKLTTKPAVIWINTTETQAKKAWQFLGYKTDPLPSPSTYYLKSNMPEPDAYHKVSSGWDELAGILRNNEVSDWLVFFHE